MSSLASTSIAAYHSIDITEAEQKVLDVIEAAGVNGCISDEVQAAYPTFSYSTVTARFSSLERKKLIYRAGDTKPGVSGRQQKIMRTVIHEKTVPALAPKSVPKSAVKSNPFLAGMVHAAKVVTKETDLASARLALQRELLKVLRR